MYTLTWRSSPPTCKKTAPASSNPGSLNTQTGISARQRRLRARCPPASPCPKIITSTGEIWAPTATRAISRLMRLRSASIGISIRRPSSVSAPVGNRTHRAHDQVHRLRGWQWIDPALDVFMQSAYDHQAHLVKTYFPQLDFRRFQINLSEKIAWMTPARWSACWHTAHA